MSLNNVKKLAKKLPTGPGVYLYKNSAGEIIYIGKAKNLRNRVRSYFNRSLDLQPRTALMVTNISDIHYILCDTEIEALMLENNLIKKHQPHFNVLLRDDKNYQFIKIDYATQIPAITTVRKIDSKRAKFYGPYTSGLAVRETLRLLRYLFPYCSEQKIGKRPCFYYHLGRCPGVCAGIISLEDYKITINKIEHFLSGGIQPTLKELSEQMHIASSTRLYERATRLRDQIRALQSIIEKQKIVSPKGETLDVIASVHAGSLCGVCVLQVRKGKLVGTQNFLLTNTKDASDIEVLTAFLEKYYSETSDLPKEVHLPFPIPTLQELSSILLTRTDKKLRISTPVRGRKRQLVKMAERNAAEFLEKASQNIQKEQAVITRAMFELKDRLKLPDLPFRIEAFDISNTQGTNPVGSMVVFDNGKPKKSDYKRFAIRGLSTPNDFAMMEEMLTRRFAHSPGVEKSENGKVESWALPDLILIDGGKGQLGVAIKVLKLAQLSIPILGLAKRLEEIFLPGRQSSLRLPTDSHALHLLQRVRDEAHRFAITYHRKKRSKSMIGLD